jgi:hypothetical protein
MATVSMASAGSAHLCFLQSSLKVNYKAGAISTELKKINISLIIVIEDSIFNHGSQHFMYIL